MRVGISPEMDDTPRLCSIIHRELEENKEKFAQYTMADSALKTLLGENGLLKST